MSQRVLFIKLLLVHYAAQSHAEILANCNDDVSLKCPGVDTDSMTFLSVTWYKLNHQSKLGIIRRGKGEKDPQYYNFTRTATFGEEHSLLLRGVSPEDSGTYECAVSANIGGQNLNAKVKLTVHVCVTQAELITYVLNMTDSGLLCHREVEDLPVKWTIIGYMAVGFTKIILSLASIWRLTPNPQDFSWFKG